MFYLRQKETPTGQPNASSEDDPQSSSLAPSVDESRRSQELRNAEYTGCPIGRRCRAANGIGR